MRIISKYHDFYDRAGIVDRSICFVREKSEIRYNIPDSKDRWSISDAHLIGYCGQFFPFLHRVIDSYTNKKTNKIIPAQHFYFYSYEDYDIIWQRGKSYKWSRESYVNFFDKWKNKQDDKLFIEFGVPIFYVRNFSYSSNYYNEGGNIVLNPILKNYGFTKIKDAQTAFQDIQTYLTNQLVKRHEPDDVDDKYRIAQHGFDSKSFRNPTRLKDLK